MKFKLHESAEHEYKAIIWHYIKNHELVFTPYSGYAESESAFIDDVLNFAKQLYGPDLLKIEFVDEEGHVKQEVSNPEEIKKSEVKSMTANCPITGEIIKSELDYIDDFCNKYNCSYWIGRDYILFEGPGTILQELLAHLDQANIIELSQSDIKMEMEKSPKKKVKFKLNNL